MQEVDNWAPSADRQLAGKFWGGPIPLMLMSYWERGGSCNAFQNAEINTDCPFQLPANRPHMRGMAI
ncbi:hypothetical protein KIP88_40295 [Bradyrhizobium sp. SRL28]|uniref:hypothetical protein n=1 Tax=Bradyrhizobium sp. SRL28 TaxID=2836178 RepID=UPI001BDF57AE|nr:hypothetical protein [Bradyrhizobium sp. SRL28]MBT1516665.1 hypothetical protein [Bradyrhizobium sp. SRL28]